MENGAGERMGNEGDKGAFDTLMEEREFAEKIKEKVYYAGIFVDREGLYEKTGAALENLVDKPHVTTNFRPNEMQLHLDSLGSNAKIYAVGYGNNGKNEGLLVRVESEDSAIQAAVDKLEVPHITLSYSKDSHPKDTASLDFKPIEEPFELTGEYGLFMQGETVAKSMDELIPFVV